MNRSNMNVMRAPSSPRVATQPQTQFRQAPIARSNVQRDFSPTVTRSQRNAPSVAFGGHVIDNTNNEPRRSFSTTTPTTDRQFTARRSGSSRDFRVPSETTRSWDRGRVHEWNRHHYRFSGGSWVIVDPGIYDYGYPYYSGGYYDSDEPVTYSSTAYSDESLAMSAQERLARLGYSPGPIDGVIGAQTRDAIADFQNDNRLPATGNLDTATVRALGL